MDILKNFGKKIKLSQVEFSFENFQHIASLLKMNNPYLLVLHTHKKGIVMSLQAITEGLLPTHHKNWA